MSPELIDAIRAHAEQCYPKESCGIVTVANGESMYVPCRNIAADADHFCIHPADYAAVEDAGVIACIVHSHPNSPPVPSDADRVGCEASGVPWLIVNWPVGHWRRFEPEGFSAPLIGREFCYGVLDCYTLIRDYYSRACNIVLPDFVHQEHFWENGEPLYAQNFAAAGFHAVDDQPQQHDVLLMMIGATVANHGAVVLGNGLILHHLMHRLSAADVYGGYFQKVTVLVLRHKDIAGVAPITAEAACAL